MRNNPFDKTVIAILGALCLAIGLVIWRGDQVGAQIVASYPANGREAGAWGRIGVQFKQPMLAEPFEGRVKLEPPVSGRVEWEGNTLWFIPEAPLLAGGFYRLQIQPGGLAADGRPLLHPIQIEIKVRQPEVLYLSTGPEANELWKVALDGQGAQRLTPEGVKVYDFAASRDGEQIIYSAGNAQGGYDLWLVRRDGRQNLPLVECGRDHCIQPAWSPDGKQVVYHRKVLTSTASVSLSGIWVLDPRSAQTDFLFPGSDTSWSPDGAYLAILDAANDHIRVLNTQTGKGIELNSPADTPVEWYPSGERMIYADLQNAGGIPFLVLSQVDLNSNHVSRLLNNEADQVEYGMPALSPDGASLVVALRILNGGLTRQLWFMRLDGSGKQAITNDETFSSASYSWDPWGSRVIFQQVNLGNSRPEPRVMLWDRSTGTTRLLAGQAALPAWLP